MIYDKSNEMAGSLSIASQVSQLKPANSWSMTS
jgi:hypothetical protein